MTVSPNNRRPRTSARVAAVQALFQAEQAGGGTEAVIAEFIHHRLGQPEGAGGFEDGRSPDADVTLFGLIVRTAAGQADLIDTMLSETLSPDWPIERLDPVLRAALRCGIAELSLAKGPPVRVVINEYIDVARGFLEGDEPGMLNGVLEKLARRLRPAEFASAPPA